MATLRRGLVDKVKKAAAKVSTRGVQVATQAGTRGARAVVETAVAAVKTVDKLQEKLGRRSTKGASAKKPMMDERMSQAAEQQPRPRAAAPMTAKAGTTTAKTATKTATKTAETATKSAGTTAKPRRAPAGTTDEAQPVALREAGRKTMPAAAPKRSKAVQAPRKQFKVKRGQKHLHTGR